MDLGRSFRVTKVYLQGGVNPSNHPLANVEVRVGNRRAEGPDNSPSPVTLLWGNTQCNVFYGPTVIEGQWIEFDCGYKDGILGR